MDERRTERSKRDDEAKGSHGIRGILPCHRAETAAPAEGNTDAESDTYGLCMQNARIAMDQEQYQKEFDELVERHSRVKQEYEEQAIAAEQDVGRVAQIDYFISTLEELNAPVTEFDEQLWISMVDHVVVHSKEDIRVVYRDGIGIG